MTSLLVLLLALPWLWPWTSGPTPNVLPFLASWACLALAVPLLATSGGARRLPQALLASWLLAAGISALIGLAQWFGVLPASSLLNASSTGEAFGNLRQRNQFASLLNLGLAALVWLPVRHHRSWIWPLVVLIAAANAASASRTGVLGLGAIALLAALWPGDRRRRLLICGLAMAAYTAAALLLPTALWHWRGVDTANVFGRAVADLGCSSRRVLWDNVLHLIAQRPWTGWGWGELDYAHYATLYPGARFCDILDNAHNLPLHVAVELGVPAAVLACAGVVWAVWRARPWRETDAFRQAAWAALLVIALHSLLEYPLWYGPFQLSVLTCVWLLLPTQVQPAAWARLATVLALGILVAVAWAAASYEAVSQAYKQPEDRRPAYRMDPVAAAGHVWLFREPLRFAELSVTPLGRANADQVYALAGEVLHYSPEPMVIEKRIESAILLGRDDDALAHLARYRAAFPERHAQWAASQGTVPAMRHPDR